MTAPTENQTNRLTSLLKIMPAGVIVLNGSGVITQCNPQASALLGEPLEGELWRTVIKRAFNPRADDGHEVSLTNGKRVKLAIEPLEGEPGQLILLTDLTETRQLQTRISHMQRLSSLGKMVASLAHQIRTPLSAAMLYASNLKQPVMAQDTRQKFSQRLNDRLHELESQVNDMLLFAKSGEQPVIADVALHKLESSFLSTAHTLADRKGIRFESTGFDEERVVKGNLTGLQGALLNLIENAIDVSEQGQTVSVTASFDKNTLLICVTDQGPGIHPDSRRNVFTPFYTTKSHGTGLGLAVVQAVAQSHDGRIDVTSPESGGSCFTLTLPAPVMLQKVAGE